MPVNRTSSFDSFFGISPHKSPEVEHVQVHHTESPRQSPECTQPPVKEPLQIVGYLPSHHLEVNVNKFESRYTQTTINIPNGADVNEDKISDASYSDEFESDSGTSAIVTEVKKANERRASDAKKNTATRRWINPYPPLRGQRFNKAVKGGQSKPPTAKQREAEYVNQRILSARRLKLNELRNELEDVERQKRDLEQENKVLKRIQQRQERELMRIEVVKGELPDVLQAHKEEVRVLKALLKQAKEKCRTFEQRIKAKDKDLQIKADELHRLLLLSESKDLLERDVLKQKVENLEHELTLRETSIKELNRKNELLVKNHKHELLVERQKHHDTMRELAKLQSDYVSLKQFKRRESEIEQWNSIAQGYDASSTSDEVSTNSLSATFTKKYETNQKVALTPRKLPKSQFSARSSDIQKKKLESKKTSEILQSLQNSVGKENKLQPLEEPDEEEKELEAKSDSLQLGTKPKQRMISSDDKEVDSLQKTLKSFSPVSAKTDKPFSPKLREDSQIQSPKLKQSDFSVSPTDKLFSPKLREDNQEQSPRLKQSDFRSISPVLDKIDKPFSPRLRGDSQTVYSPKLMRSDKVFSPKLEESNQVFSPKSEISDQSFSPNVEKDVRVDSPHSSETAQYSPSRRSYDSSVFSALAFDVDHNRNIVVSTKDGNIGGSKNEQSKLSEVDLDLNQGNKKMLLSKLKGIDNEMVASNHVYYKSLDDSSHMKEKKQHHKEKHLTKANSDFTQEKSVESMLTSKLYFNDYDNDEDGFLSFGSYKPSFGKGSGRSSVQSNHSDKEKKPVINNRGSDLLTTLFGTNTENVAHQNKEKILPWDEGKEDELKTKDRTFRRRGSYQYDEVVLPNTVESDASQNSPEFVFGKKPVRPSSRKGRIISHQSYDY